MEKSKCLYESPAVAIVAVKTEGVICVSPTASRRSYGAANAEVATNEMMDSDGSWIWD